MCRFRRAPKTIDSLAILPLANETHDPETDYLSDGITEMLINNLSQLPKLRVLPRSTVFRYKGREMDPTALRRELGVRAVLTGRVVHRADTLTIKVELVDVARQAQLWGGNFSRKLDDIFAVQEEIARQISEHMRLHLSPQEKKKLAARDTGTARRTKRSCERCTSGTNGRRRAPGERWNIAAKRLKRILPMRRHTR